MRLTEIKPVYVETIPKKIEEGVLYISKKYGCTIHLCACGCGEKTVMEIKPEWKNGWSLTEVDGNVSFSPSIGNWNFPCRSHYYITNNKIIWL